MIRDLTLNEARRVVADDRKAKRLERKRAATEYLRARREVPAPGQRQPRQRNNAFLQFVRRHPCCICGTARHIEAAHIRSGYPEAGWSATGMQEKPDDARALPLCADHHRDGPDAQHKANERSWWASHGIHPPALCARLMAAFLAGGEPVQLTIRTQEPR